MRTSVILATAAGAVSLAGTPATAAPVTGFIQETAGTYDYNDTANWIGGTINGIWDPSLNISAAYTVTFGADTALSTGLDFSYTGGNNVTLRGTGANRTVTLGGDIDVNTASTTRTITLGTATANQALNVDLGGATRTFTVGTGRALSFVNVVSNGGIIASGGTLNFSGANTYAGATTVTSGNFSLNGATGGVASSDVTVESGASLTFSGSSGSGTTRAKSVTLNGFGSGTGATLSVTGNSSANTIETITNALAVEDGFTTVTVTPNASRNTRLSAGSFSRAAGTTTLFRGTNLGVNSAASQTAGSANVTFGATPALVGAGGSAGTSTISILKGAYGDVSAGGTGSSGGLMTVDATNGLRLLNTGTEYAGAIADGQTQLDNVRIARASGGASQDVTLTSATTTVNSLSFAITGAGTNSGVTIGGNAGTTLRLNSGAIFASQLVTTAAPTDAMTINVPTLDLNGQEGVFLAFTNGISNGNTNAPLRIDSVITNDGGNGLTIGGTGQVWFGGASANTYTGVTTLNSGVLRLAKTTLNTGLTTDLVVNGGILLKNTNAIADTASVTLNGGQFIMDTTTSSGNNGHAETVNNFTVNGGSFINHGTSAALTVNGDLTLNASQLGMNQGGDVTVAGDTALNGGLLVAKESTSTTAFNGVTTLNTLSITNTPGSAYTAMTVTAHGTNKGARVILNGDVTFTGNGSNANPVLINSSNDTLANQGFVELNGTRTFNVGNGAAGTDLSVAVALANGASTGALTKTGLGTLELTGASIYAGATTVNAGRLLVNGSLAAASAVTVNSNGTLGGNGTVGGATSITGGTLAPGASAGLLTFGSTLGLGGTSAFEVDGLDRGVVGGYDAVNVGTELTYGGVLNVAFSSTFAEGSTFNLFDFGTFTGNFTGINLTGSYAAALADLGGGNWSGTAGGQGFEFSTSTGVLSVVAVAVPEPTALGLLVAGAGLSLRRRRVR